MGVDGGGNTNKCEGNLGLSFGPAFPTSLDSQLQITWGELLRPSPCPLESIQLGNHSYPAQWDLLDHGSHGCVLLGWGRGKIQALCWS